MMKQEMTFNKTRLLVSKALVFLGFVISSGAPFVWMRRIFLPSIADLILYSLLIIAFLFHTRELFCFNKDIVSWFFGIIVLFCASLRYKIIPPFAFSTYDLLFVLLAFYLLYRPSRVKELLRFSIILMLPLSAAEFVSFSPGVFQRIWLILSGLILSILVTKFLLPIKLMYIKLNHKRAIDYAFVILLTGILIFFALIFQRGRPKNGRILFDITHGNTQSPLLDYTKDISKGVIFGHGKLVDLLKRFGFQVAFSNFSSNVADSKQKNSLGLTKDAGLSIDNKDKIGGRYIKNPITPEALADVSILVLIMPSEYYLQEELETIRDFVYNGGGLLAIGDHTNISNCLDTINPVIDQFGISLLFDTLWLQLNDRKDLSYRHHPIFFDVDRVNFSVGASLKLYPPAKMILQSDYACYSDIGDILNKEQGYLGNSQLDSKERIHDLCLVAESHYGKGRVIVLGDSSYFQNTSVYQNVLFAYRTFDWLNHFDEGLSFWIKKYDTIIRIYICILFIAFIIWLLPSPVLTYLLMLIISLQWLAGFYNFKRFPVPENRLDTVLIDMSHQNEYTPYWVSREKSDVGIDGLIDQIIRCGFYPVIQTKGPIRFKDLVKHRAAVVICPNIPYDKSEIGDFQKYVEQGGGLLCVDGPRKWAQSSGLWDSFGIYKDRYPLSASMPILSNIGLPIKLAYGDFNAWFIPHEITNGVFQIKMINPCKVYGGLPLAFINNTPVINFKEFGNGRIVAIGDDRFFANFNTESEGKIMDYNKIRMIWNIMDYIVIADPR